VILKVKDIFNLIMIQRGIANLPLHGGKAPKWLFQRMVSLSKKITDIIIYEYGRKEFFSRLSDPFWFQALSCVLGYDWHSSGTTTVTCGALKEALDPERYGFAIAGGKGKASRKTLEEIDKYGDLFNLSNKKIKNLNYTSRMSAKIDNSSIQDGHSLYHHVFIFSEDNLWSVIQQGMNPKTGYARRYHWFSEDFDKFFLDPHKAIVGKKSKMDVLNMVSTDSKDTQKTSVDLVCDNPRQLQHDWAYLTKHTCQTTLDECHGRIKEFKKIESLDMPRSINWNKMKEIYEFQPKNYEELIGLKGVGSSTIRALALVSELIYGDKPSWTDPVKFTFAHGGKDGVPFEVDRPTYSNSIDFLREAISMAEIDDKDRLRILKRLRNLPELIDIRET
jgi:hypothetical protein